MPVTLDAHEFDLLRRTIHSNSIVALKIDGKETQQVMVHGIHIDPRSRHLLHVDLFALKSGEEVTVEIPLHTTGEAYAATKLGGTLLHTVDRVRVRALPENLPEALEVSVELAGRLRRRRSTFATWLCRTRVTLLSDPDEVVAKVIPQRAAEEPTAVAPVEEAAEEARLPRRSPRANARNPDWPPENARAADFGRAPGSRSRARPESGAARQERDDRRPKDELVVRERAQPALRCAARARLRTSGARLSNRSRSRVVVR